MTRFCHLATTGGVDPCHPPKSCGGAMWTGICQNPRPVARHAESYLPYFHYW